MKVYNLTDACPAWEKGRTPSDLKFRGVTIPPGGHIEVEDRYLSELAGWVMSHMVSVNGLPAWYQAIKMERRRVVVPQPVEHTKTRVRGRKGAES